METYLGPAVEEVRSLVLKGRHGHARVGVLTVLPEEFEAVRHALDAHIEVDGTTACYAPEHDDGRVPFVVTRCTDRTISPAAESTQYLLSDWRPEIVVLAGIAGGIQRPRVGPGGGIEWKGLAPGDLIVCSYVHYAAYTKNVPGEELQRYFPIDHPPAAPVQRLGDALAIAAPGETPWFEDVGCDRPAEGAPRIEIGEIIHVEGVAGAPLDAHQKRFLARFDHAIGVDMESAGVGRGVHAARTLETHYSSYNPVWLGLRAVSDRVYAVSTEAHEAALPPDADNNAERELWKRYACAVVGRASREVVTRLLKRPRPAYDGDNGAPAFFWPVDGGGQEGGGQ